MRSRAGGKHPPLICFSKSVKHLILRCFRTNSKKALWRFHSAFLILRTIPPVPARERPPGRQPTPRLPCNSCRAAGGKRHLPLRAQRALKGRWEIDKREETVGFLSLARSRRAGANFIHWGSRHARISSGEPLRDGRAMRAPTGRDAAQAQILSTWEVGTPVPRQANRRGTDAQCAPLRAGAPRRRKFHPLGKQACPYLVRRTIAGRTHSARPCIFHHASVRYCCGSTFSSFTCTSKCRCGPVELPVLPESAICSPLATTSPTETSSSELCAYSVL